MTFTLEYKLRVTLSSAGCTATENSCVAWRPGEPKQKHWKAKCWMLLWDAICCFVSEGYHTCIWCWTSLLYADVLMCYALVDFQMLV